MSTPANNKTFSMDGAWAVLLRDLKVDARTVLRRSGLPDDLLSRDEVAISSAEYFRFWRAIETEAGGSTFSLRLGQIARTESFHPVLFAALCSSDFSIAARRISHYKRLVAPLHLHIEEDATSFTLIFNWLDKTEEPPPSLAAFELVFMVQLVRIATRERVQPLEVQCPVPLLPVDEYEMFFGRRPEHCERHALTFAAADARRPFLTENEGMWLTFEPTLRQRLAQLDASATLPQRVRAALLEGLPGGQSSMEDIARKLGASKRTLQRQLRNEQTTFQAVLDKTREELALHYLRKTKLTGSEISYLLGFQDPNSFFRAFHNWTGQTTEQARLAH